MKPHTCLKRSRTPALLMMAVTMLLPARLAWAGRARLIQETVEYVTRKFSTELGEETAETLTRKLAAAARDYGDDAIAAVRKVGPRALHLADEAGEHGSQALGLLARHGRKALWVAGDPQRLALAARLGDDAAEAMIHHKGIARSMLRTHGDSAAGALRAVGPRNGRRLAMLDETGELTRTGKAEQLLSVVGRYGDRAADFIWRNKGTLLIGSTLAVFLKDPEPFIDGTRDLAQIAAVPVTEATRELAREAARQTNWTAVTLVGLGLVTLLLVSRFRRTRPARS